MTQKNNNSDHPLTPGRVIGIIFSFMFWWPAGLYLLIKTIKQIEEYEQTQSNIRRENQRYSQNFGQSTNQQKRSSAQDATIIKDNKRQTSKEPKKGGGMKLKQILLNVFGGIFSLSGLITLVDMLSYGFYASDMALGGIFLGGGLGMLFMGNEIKKKLKRYKKYAAIIGESDSVLIETIASKIPTTYDKACKDLEDMIDEGFFGDKAYLDISTSRFMRNSNVVVEDDTEDTVEEFTGNYKETIDQIRKLNDEIKDENTSSKIARIEEITAKIFKILEEKPEKKNILRTFLNYYLPTTLKLLDDYRRLESQSANSANVKKARKDIENILDTLVLAYEQQLDAMFEEDFLDISSEISALESMMAQDFAINYDPFKQKLNSDGTTKDEK
ncbi:MAG: 5-bromo-4-chloroindolyl phosphate hydrolysis family protein [Ruminococcus sp.]|nr:5-bromo-4-chloroindolyl phosphate hydrolysis family protein [Ruminococcus sp.]MBR6801483.1 5-bromo-4-chloroindolyl phosphate hydrolysis family protein [Eubacteriaceae bacterium]